MWRDEAFRHFRRTILATHRSSLRTGYFISWDEKKGATPLGNGWRYRTFQIVVIFCIVVALPLSLIRWHNLAFSVKGVDIVDVWFASFCLVYVWIGVQFMWSFAWPYGPKKFVRIFESMLHLEEELQGEVFI